MKKIIILLFALCSSLCWAQADPYADIEIDPNMVKPDLFMSVEPVSASQQKLTITILHEGYPMELLRAQAQEIGVLTGQPIDIVEIVATDLGTQQKLDLARAVVIVGGVLGPRPGEIQFEALFYPFLGIEEPFTIDSASLTIDQFEKTDFTLREITAGSVRGVGSYAPENKRIDYRFVFLSQERNEVEIPSLVEKEISDEGKNDRNPLFNPWIIPGVTVVLIAIGALVYFLWLRRVPKT